MIANGIYRLVIVGAYMTTGAVRVHFRVWSEEEQVLWRDFAIFRPDSLRDLLESCGMRVPLRPVRLDLDSLVGKELLGTVVAGHHIEFYEANRVIPGLESVVALLERMPQYIM